MGGHGEGVTMREVALRAGVSISTVSNVLTGKRERMKTETFERVSAAIAQLSYAPNLLARELKTGFVPIIGLIVPSVANPFWGAFASCMEHEARQRGCHVMLCNSERDVGRELEYAQAMLSRGIRGLILGSSPLSFDHLVGLTERGMKIVAFDRSAQETDLLDMDSVRVDNINGARMAVNHLLGLGHRRIAFVSGPTVSCNRIDRLEGFRLAMKEAGLEPPASHVWLRNSGSQGGDDDGTEIGRQAALSMLREPNRPTACFAINDQTALGIYSGARELGLHIPDELSVMGFDNISLCRVVDPEVTTIRQPLPELMHEALDLLFGRLDGSLKGPARHLILQPDLVLRGSTAALA
jgi:DNA-binding LacI/PurR family transcriptional regulator